MKVIWDAIKELKEEVRIVDRRLNSEYVRRDDFKESMADLKTDMRQGFQNVDGTLRLLFKKLENKEDK